MRRCLGVISLILMSLVAVPANPEASGTNLIMKAHWNNNQAIRGTVTLIRATMHQAETTIVAKPLYEGQAEVNVALAENAVYEVTLVEPDGKKLLEFPITTALINPKNLASAEIDIVCRTTDRSIVSARATVLMTF
jgi:hypothetical protein